MKHFSIFNDDDTILAASGIGWVDNYINKNASSKDIKIENNKIEAEQLAFKHGIDVDFENIELSVGRLIFSNNKIKNISAVKRINSMVIMNAVINKEYSKQFDTVFNIHSIMIKNCTVDDLTPLIGKVNYLDIEDSKINSLKTNKLIIRQLSIFDSKLNNIRCWPEHINELFLYNVTCEYSKLCKLKKTFKTCHIKSSHMTASYIESPYTLDYEIECAKKIGEWI